MLVKQAPRELPAELLVRVFRRATLLEQSGRRLRQILFAVAPRRDAQTTAGRRTIAQALLSLLSACGEGELSFWAAATEPLVRHELMALVETLLIDPRAAGASVRVRFVVDAEPSAQRQVAPDCSQPCG